jgi:hypothetical protein
MNAATMHLDLQPSGDRVRRHTAAAPNERIEAYTRWRIDETVRGGRDAIVARLTELEKEWDIDRVLMLNFAIVGGTGFAMGAAPRKFKKWLNGWQVFTTTQLAFLALHAIVGWCPPAALFRRLGFRTSREIESERRALRQALERAE